MRQHQDGYATQRQVEPEDVAQQISAQELLRRIQHRTHNAGRRAQQPNDERIALQAPHPGGHLENEIVAGAAHFFLVLVGGFFFCSPRFGCGADCAGVWLLSFPRFRSPAIPGALGCSPPVPNPGGTTIWLGTCAMVLRNAGSTPATVAFWLSCSARM